ncbi:Ion transport domain containing protein [Parasponia andersonii]|uniref:Ion transport domain containing protein n=1 Tax=Parasponia andersonii TaxID=3476 RepID=A0A2P5DFR0_PARAD|nr:Ion transport domain containing protein [Parasponia andersonii]
MMTPIDEKLVLYHTKIDQELANIHIHKPPEKVGREPEWTEIQTTTFAQSNQGAHSKKKGNQKPFLPIWNKFFIFACVVAVSLDPLFFYIPTIDQDNKCSLTHKKLAIFAVVSRFFVDVTYVLDIIYNVAKASEALKIDKQSGLTWKRGDQFVDYALAISRSLSWPHILVDFLAILPIPQVVILALFPKLRGHRALVTRKILNLVLLSQYVPRVIRIYQSSRELTRTPDLLKTPVWVKGAFNFFLYILASHVFGAFWYFFSFQRITSCWFKAYSGQFGNEKTIQNGCYGEPFGQIIEYLNSACPVKTPNSTVFDFGIFLGALQSDLLESHDFPKKLLNCFWWGLRNLSSLGQNLQTSTYMWENLLAVSISISGLLLFLYLIGNLQTYMQLATTRSEELRRKMKMKELDVELWIAKNDLGKERKAEIMQKLKCKLRDNNDVDIENLLSILSPEDRKSIKRQLCLPRLRKTLRNKKKKPVNSSGTQFANVGGKSQSSKYHHLRQ